MDEWIPYFLLCCILALQIQNIIKTAQHSRAQRMWRRYLERSHRLERILVEAQRGAAAETRLPLWASVMFDDASEYFLDVGTEFRRDQDAAADRRGRMARLIFWRKPDDITKV